MIFWILAFSIQVFATDCNNPPQPPGGRIGPAWWSQYSSWCRACGGTTYQNSSGGGCNPGPNWGGGSASSGGGGSYGSGLDPSQQLMLNVMQTGLQELFRQPTPQEQEAARQRAIIAEQERIAAEAERQRLIKEKNDKMDAEADSTMALLGTSSSVSDEDLLKQTAPAKAEKPLSCKERRELIARLEGEGLKRLDINIGKTRKMIKQAEESGLQADKDAVALAGDVVAGEMVSAMEEFAKNKKTIEAMKQQLKKLKGGQLANADVDKLQSWIDGGLTAGNGVMDAYERAKKGNEFKFSDPNNSQWKQQMLTSLSEFNAGFMADTGAWELAGEHLSKTLGPAGPIAFKTSVLGIKVAANRGAKMISQNDLNEQKYHLGNMMKTRAEMAQRVKDLKREQAKCAG